MSIPTVEIAAKQFMISGAGETIKAVSELSDVFAPPYHGPRDIPISVELLSSEYSYVHFPFVNTGKYAIYLDTPDIFDGFIYAGTNQSTGTGTPIATEPTSVGGSGAFAQGFVSTGEIIFNGNDPQPIAIRLKNANNTGKMIRYIVSAL